MIESLDLPPLPEGWVWTKLGEIVVEIERGNPKDTPERDFIYLDIASIDNSQQKITNPKKYFGENAPSRARQLVKSGDILFSTVRTYLKNIAIVNEIYDGQIASTGFCVVRPYDLINRRLIFYLVQTDFFLNPLTQIQRGTSYPAVRDSDVFTQFIPLPPLPEQHRIVSKIEELFTKLDAGVDELKKIKAQLKSYRQAVLKYAFEGKLTEEWREAHTNELEPASILLERIKEERKRNAKGKYKELPPVDTSELPEVPEGWVWTNVGNISSTIHYGYTASASNEPVGPKMLRITDIQNNSVDWGTVPYCQINPEEKLKYLLEVGDLVFARTGATVGKSYLIKGIIPEAVFASYLIRIILSDHLEKKFVNYFFHSNTYWLQIYKGQIGIGQPNVNSKILAKMVLPFSSLPEQHKIVEEIERRFSVADNVEQAVDQSLKQADRLRQSILKSAFEGKLVPQDPTDEPASVLLERIKAGRENRKIEEKSKPNKIRRKRELVQVQKQTRFNDYV